MFTPYHCFSILFCCFLIVGCGSPKPYDVWAVVTLDGEPLSGAEVSLLSVRDDAISAIGMTDSEGKVTFKTEEVEGVFSGTYIATVSKIVEERRLSNNEIRALAELGIQYGEKWIELVPEKYARRETSNLKIKVGYWHPKNLTFVLQSEGNSP